MLNPKIYSILSISLLIILLFGCTYIPAGPTPVSPTTDPSPNITDPTPSPTDTPTDPTDPPTDPPTEPPTDPTTPNESQLWGSMDQVTVYPYDEADLKQATDYWYSVLSQVENQETVLEFECQWISFDPYYTNHICQSYIHDNPTEGWNDEDYYARTICLVFSFTVKYDHTKSPGTDYTNQLGSVVLTRKSPDAPWEFSPLSPSAFTYCYTSTVLLSPEKLNELDLAEGFVLAGYFLEADNSHHPVEQDTYYLFVLDQDTNAVVCKIFPVE